MTPELLTHIKHIAWILGGLVLIALVLFDVFETVVVPNLGARQFRLTSFLIRQMVWPIWRLVADLFRRAETKRDFLSLFAPASVLFSLLVWINGLLLGFALILMSVSHKVSPPITDLGTAFYFSGAAVLTVGFGDIVPVGPAVRIVVIFGTIAGVIIMALVTSLVFSLHSIYQRREAHILRLEGRAGVPPCGLTILENHANRRLIRDMEEFFAESELWFADVLTSHTAYPFMLFFRSLTFGNSWVASLGAVMDASMMVQSMLRLDIGGASVVTYRMGLRVMTEIDSFYRLRRPHYNPESEHKEFLRLRETLRACGYELKHEEESWAKFVALRAEYWPKLLALGDYLGMPVSSLSHQTPAQFADSMLRVYASARR